MPGIDPFLLLFRSEDDRLFIENGVDNCGRNDREYFNENFKGNPGNVFFILNKTDLIASNVEREQALERVRQDVKGCFTKADGSVDEALMCKRVFGLSSLLALDARRGMTFDEDLQKDVPLSQEKIEQSKTRR